MKDIQIMQAEQSTTDGAKLHQMALQEMAQMIVGTEDDYEVEQTLGQLWQHQHNRFSFHYAYVAKAGKKTVGMISCYPATLLQKLAWPTVKRVLAIRQWPLIQYTIRHLPETWQLLRLDEGRKDEFHIAALAAAPESRGMGVGTKLIAYAEQLAREQHFQKLSLTVKQNNEGARLLYERLGFRIVDRIDKKPFYLYRMVKLLG
ncbi:GNAT family N-acetyltransferase [Paenibacillus sp. NPDC058071]|uniref:GNAT family N-acetyltransferase n=1 Tax=Paenibacillus sp. NPDC058071 TaxID=3346326 RepID=UPI0036D85290